MANKTLYLYTDGKTIKNIDLPQYPDSAWNFITGEPENANQTETYYSSVAPVFRVANLSADAIANIPFAVVNGDQDFDSSESWQNKVGFLPNPKELLRLWRLSLFMTNQAYGFMEGNKAIKNMRYIVPTTIKPITSKDAGLIGFKRVLGTEERKYSLDENRIFYVWRLDHTTELLPSKNTEFQALMAAAGVLFYSDYYVQSFFQRGGIKPTMLMVKGVPNPAEREKIENIWDKVVHGWTKYLGKVFNADSLEPHVIGEGIDNIKDSTLRQDKVEDIAMAAGMPLSLLLSNSANYATAQVEYAVWFRDSVIPWANFISGEMNRQLFNPLGLRFEFRPELSEHGQEEEVQRASAYKAYIDAGMRPSIAAQVVGIDLPPDIEFDALDENYDKPVEEPKEEEQKDEEPQKTAMTIEQLRELELWQSFAFRKLKQGKSLDFPFVCKTLTEDIASRIREALPNCRTEREIETVFSLSHQEAGDMKDLAVAITRAVEALV